MIKKALFVISCVAVMLGVSSCSHVPRGLDHQITPPSPVQEAVQNETHSTFAAQAGAMGSGETQTLSLEGGTATVTDKGSFKNALGETCRSLTVRTQTGTPFNASVCLGLDNVWRYLPPLK